MKISKMIYALLLVLPTVFGVQQAMQSSKSDLETPPVKLEWQSIQDIENLPKDKFTLVDVYTDWCKVCQVMEDKTMADEAFSAYLVSNYNLVKFNAEEKGKLSFKGESYEFKSNGKRGFNALAAELCLGRLAYPSFVILDKDLEVVDVLRGFKNVEKFKADLDRVMFAAANDDYSKD